jgi:hypothetical protein
MTLDKLPASEQTHFRRTTCFLCGLPQPEYVQWALLNSILLIEDCQIRYYSLLNYLSMYVLTGDYIAG